MEDLHGPSAFAGAEFAVEVKGQTLLQVGLGADAVNALMRLAEAAVSWFFVLQRLSSGRRC